MAKSDSKNYTAVYNGQFSSVIFEVA